MIRRDELRGYIAKRGSSQRKIAEIIGVTEKTFYNKMKKGVFSNDEIEKICTFLNIDDPAYIFLPSLVRDKYQDVRRDA